MKCYCRATIKHVISFNELKFVFNPLKTGIRNKESRKTVQTKIGCCRIWHLHCFHNIYKLKIKSDTPKTVTGPVRTVRWNPLRINELKNCKARQSWQMGRFFVSPTFLLSPLFLFFCDLRKHPVFRPFSFFSAFHWSSPIGKPRMTPVSFVN